MSKDINIWKQIKEKFELTPKELNIIQEYFQNGNVQWKAYIKYNPTKNPTTARSESSTLFAKQNIREAVTFYMDSKLVEFKDTLHYELIEKYRKRALYSISDFIDMATGELKPDIPEEDMVVIDGTEEKSIPIGGGLYKQTTVYKFADRNKALDQLTKYMGLVKDKVEVTGKDGAPLTYTINFVKPDKEEAV